jgi:tetratricopeptide (TPR) repeat protein
MFIFFLILFVVIVALAIIIAIILRHLQRLSAVDLASLPQEKNQETKTGIMEDRLKRKINVTSKNFSKNYLVPIGSLIKARLQKTSQKLKDLEKKYHREAKLNAIVDLKNEELLTHIKEKLATGQELLAAEKIKEAEDAFIEVIALDPKNVAAYFGLAQTYQKQADLEHAQEIFEHVLKIDEKNSLAMKGLAELRLAQGNFEDAAKTYEKMLELSKDNPEFYFNYGNILEKINNYAKALEMYQKAADLKPNDPRYLDYFLESSILNRKKYLAYKAFDQLKETNPENQKLDDFKKRIEEI